MFHYITIFHNQIITRMSEGSVTYVDQGEPCGITTVINSELRNFLVCKDNLVCVEGHENSVTGKICVSSEVNRRSNPCFETTDDCQCLENELGIYTCGGVSSVFEMNDIGISATVIQESQYKGSPILTASGACMIVLYGMLIVFFRARKN